MAQAATMRRGTRKDRLVLEDTTQYVTCCVGDETFAITVPQVREVLDVGRFTRVPNMPPSVRGMVDVRGKAVPVIDLRVKFGLPAVEPTDHTRIIVLEVVVDGRPLVIGALTDRVYEVTALDAGAVSPPPEIGKRWGSDIIRGIGRRKEKFVIVLNLNRVFTMDDLTGPRGG